ncbi:MAG: M24 family metallopeptidase [Planctomycetaceae bacterium]
MDRHADRMRRAAAEGATQGFDAVVVAPSPDLAYLAAYDPMPLERPTLLILRPGRTPVVLVPELERPLAAASAGGAHAELVGWVDGVDPYAEAARLLPASGRVAVGDRIWGAHLLALQAALPGVTFSPASSVLGRLRAIKDDDELGALRRAAAGADAAFGDVCALAFVGRRETEVAADLARLLVEHGHDRADFTIVASGPNAASPHHEPGERTIERGDAVVLDFGGALDGYFSDTTRTVVVGEPPEGFEPVYALVRAAQAAAVETVRPGVAIQEVDRAARRVIAEAGYGDRFVHRTGHGIGLEVHEPPYAVEGDTTVLEPGMTFSVEPGVYLEGRFGVRIEDIVAVTADGVERLNTTTRDLQVV